MKQKLEDDKAKYRVATMITKDELDFIRFFRKQNSFSESKAVRYFIQFYMRSIDFRGNNK